MIKLENFRELNYDYFSMLITRVSTKIPLILLLFLLFSNRKADIALIGLAVMGQNLILNMDSHGFVVCAYNRTVDKVIFSKQFFYSNIFSCWKSVYLSTQRLPSVMNGIFVNDSIIRNISLNLIKFAFIKFFIETELGDELFEQWSQRHESHRCYFIERYGR